MLKECEICRNQFQIKPSDFNERFTCSSECGFKRKKRLGLNSGKNHSNWKGGKEKHAAGYVLIYSPNHPDAHRGKVLEHRIVTENFLGRKLNSLEIVHHKNGIKTDNRIENLELTTRSSHIEEHRKQLEANKIWLPNKGSFKKGMTPWNKGIKK